MENIDNIMQLCRLCLVKDQVNIPIFGGTNDLEGISSKISSCLPVKVAPDDSLPKKICDGCSYKLDLLYAFRNTSISSEKQLYQWLEQAGISKSTSGTISTTQSITTPIISTNPPFPSVPISTLDTVINDTITKSEISVKQEKTDSTAGSELSAEAQEYLLQQQKLPYQENFGDFNTTGTNSAADNEEPVCKKPRRAAASKSPIKDDDSDPDMPPTKAEDDSDEDIDDPGDGGMDDDDDDDEEEEDDGLDNPEFVDVPSTSAEEQPGPSGVNKDPIAAPSQSSSDIHTCNICLKIFRNREEFVKHHLHQYGETFDCCKCGKKFKTTTDLYEHLDGHRKGLIVEEQDELNNEYVEEIVLNYENEEVVEEAEETPELVYILDDSQCVNEVVIDEESDTAATTSATKTRADKQSQLDNVTIVKLEHGYVIPETIDAIINGKQKSVTSKTQPSTSKVQQYVNQSIKPSSRLPQPKRHVVPDFSSPNYIYVNANEEIDIPHFKCLRCEQIFINKFVFFRHIEKGKCYINNCDVCTATFMKNSEFYYHYIVEHTDRAICNFCFRTFMYEKNVKEHMLRHLDQFRHRCDECNKGFYTVREYRNHYKNRHMGIRHTCDYCNRSFADEYYFRRHIATHQQTNIVVQ